MQARGLRIVHTSVDARAMAALLLRVTRSCHKSGTLLLQLSYGLCASGTEKESGITNPTALLRRDYKSRQAIDQAKTS